MTSLDQFSARFGHDGVVASNILSAQPDFPIIATTRDREVRFSFNTRVQRGWKIRTNRVPLPVAERRKLQAQTFERLSQAWRRKTLNMSSTTAMVMLPEYQQIIGMGWAALPHIMQDFRSNIDDPAHWHWALTAIVGESPVIDEADMGNTRKIAEAWLQWWAVYGDVLL